MALTTRLEIRQGQQLVMTPQLQQAIKLLQYSNLELTQFVEGELERNPLLEREDGGETVPSRETESRADDGEALAPLDLTRVVAESVADTFDTDHASAYPDETPADQGRGQTTSGWETMRASNTTSSNFADDDANHQHG